MKKILSVFLSVLMLISCFAGMEITANAATKENKTLSYRYDYETKTLYVTGKGKIPGNYLGWGYEEQGDMRWEELTKKESDKYYIFHYSYGEEPGLNEQRLDDSRYSQDDYVKEEIYLKGIYPDYYIDITRHVKKLVIGEGITDIGYEAFGWAFPKLEKLTLPSTLKTIGEAAFEGCGNLKSVVIPSAAKTVEHNAFYLCDKLTAVVFNGKSTKAVDSDYVGDEYSNPYDQYETFYASNNTTIYALKDSEMAKYCKKYKLKYKTVTNPKKVSGLKASTTGSTVKLTWSKVSGATQYQVQRYVVSQKKWKTYATVKSNTYTFKNMSGSTNYKFRVRAVKKLYEASFNGAYSKTLNAKTKIGKVSGVKLSSKGKKLTVKWSKAKGAADYQVYYSASKNGKYTKLTTTSKTSYTSKKLKKGKTYYVKVRARSKTSKGKYTSGAFSAVKSVKIK